MDLQLKEGQITLSGYIKIISGLATLLKPAQGEHINNQLLENGMAMQFRPDAGKFYFYKGTLASNKLGLPIFVEHGSEKNVFDNNNTFGSGWFFTGKMFNQKGIYLLTKEIMQSAPLELRILFARSSQIHELEHFFQSILFPGLNETEKEYGAYLSMVANAKSEMDFKAGLAGVVSSTGVTNAPNREASNQVCTDIVGMNNIPKTKQAAKDTLLTIPLADLKESFSRLFNQFYSDRIAIPYTDFIKAAEKMKNILAWN